QSEISPTVAYTPAASMIGGIRLSLPRAAPSSAASFSATALWLRPARTWRKLSICDFSSAGSSRNVGTTRSSSFWKRFTPTTTRWPLSMPRWQDELDEEVRRYLEEFGELLGMYFTDGGL